MTHDSSRTADGSSPARVMVVFTDLDGTLLDHETYAFDAAREALAALRTRGVPVVPVTSKTRAELAPLRERLGLRGPYVVENGGAIVIPRGTFAGAVPGARALDAETEVVALGSRYADVVAALAAAAAETGVRVRGFASMDDAAVAAATGLAPEDAARARQREYGEAFTILDEGGAPALLAALERRGMRWTRGGRFHHVFAGNDKGEAVRRLAGWWRAERPGVRTMALGDAPNDAPMLRAVDVPVVVRGRASDALRALVPHARVTTREGPAGWGEAVMEELG